jgi:hypothetical protein
MTQDEGISLHESLPSDVGKQEPRGTDEDASNLNQADSRQRESSRKRALLQPRQEKKWISFGDFVLAIQS